MMSKSDSDKALEERKAKLYETLYDRHMHLSDVHANFQEAQQQMDVVLRTVLDQLTQAQSRKIEFLQSVKRQVLSQFFFLQWLEDFQAHAQLALPPADFIVAKGRHADLVAAFFDNGAHADIAFAQCLSQTLGIKRCERLTGLNQSPFPFLPSGSGDGMFDSAEVRLIVVMVLTPIVMNAFQFWITDNFIKKRPDGADGKIDVEQQRKAFVPVQPEESVEMPSKICT